MHTLLIQKINQALTEIEFMASQNWAPAQSISTQLHWCLSLANHQPTPSQGLLTMGLIATREFDMYGDNPALADLINDIQRQANYLLSTP